jgi:phage FluMu gp28-like protein
VFGWWIQQSHYVAGSQQPQASRLTVHTILVDSACRERLAENITQLSNAVYQEFVTAVRSERRAI